MCDAKNHRQVHIIPSLYSQEVEPITDYCNPSFRDVHPDPIAARLAAWIFNHQNESNININLICHEHNALLRARERNKRRGSQIACLYIYIYTHMYKINIIPLLLCIAKGCIQDPGVRYTGYFSYAYQHHHKDKTLL